MGTQVAYYVFGVASGVFVSWIFTQALGGCHLLPVGQ